jgi:hypothetical protein
MTVQLEWYRYQRPTNLVVPGELCAVTLIHRFRRAQYQITRG